MKAVPVTKAGTVEEAVNPILIVSKLAAVGTITRDSHKKEFIVSRFWVTFQIIVTIISVLHLISIPYSVIYIERISQEGYNEDSDHGLNSQSFITKMANIVLISAAAIAVRLFGLIQMHKTLPSLLNTISVLDHSTFTEKNHDRIWILLFSVILIIISWPYQFYSIVMITTDNWVALLMFSLNLYNNFSIICCEFQFVSFCWIINRRIKNLNDELRELGDKTMVGADQRLIKRITRIRNAYRVLVEGCAQLNTLYNFQLFVILSSLNLCVLFNLYFAIFGGFKRESSISESETPYVTGSINDVIWSFYYFGRLFFICTVAGNLIAQANSTKMLVCNMMDRYLEKELKRELRIFLAFTMSNDMHFSACGFFKVDTALITSAVSTGATYLVILAQFHIRE